MKSFIFVLLATIFEASGDALIRMGIYDHTGVTLARTALFVVGAVLVFCYGFSLNLAPLHFNQVVGLYIAMLFVVWQIVNYISFKTLPTPNIFVGGALIVLGGLIVTFWDPVKA